MSALAQRPPIVSDVLLPALLDAIGEGVVLLDETHLIQLINRAGTELSGYSPGTLVGQPLQALFPDADVGLWLKHTKRQRSASEPNLAQLSQALLQKPDGSHVAVELTVTGFASSRGGDQVIVVFRDLSERARLAQQLAQIRKLTLVATLGSSVPQQLGDLLAAIQVATDGLAQGLPGVRSAEAHANLQQLRAAAARAGDLAGQLLAFGGPGRLELHPIDLASVLQEITPTLQRLLPSWVALNCRAEAGPLLVRAAPGALEGILLELVTNARQAMPRGGLLTVDLRLVQIETASPSRSDGPPPGEYVCLSVDDTGVGLDAEARARVFKPFFSNEPALVGTGFGTAMVHGLVKQHGGYITVHSAPRRGTTIRVYLPVLEQPRPLPSPATAAAPIAPIVLVVDDEEPLLRIAHRALQHCGYRVLTAQKGVDALAILRAHRGEIGVVVSDLSMPGLGGRELHEAARRDGIDLPFVFTSGYAPGEALEPEGESFLRKPWTIDDLVRRVRQSLGDAPGAGPAAAG